MAPPHARRKLRILCLHGYLQSADLFRSRTGSLRKGLKSRAELLYMDAPYAVEEAIGGSEEVAVGYEGARADASEASDSGPYPREAERRSWWRTDGKSRPSQVADLPGWGGTREAIAEALRTAAPVDGILGFSQGAAAAAMFLAEASSGDVSPPPPLPRFAILIAGFVPGFPSELPPPPCGSSEAAPSILLPTLHVMGEGDNIIPPAQSRLLACRARDPSFLSHPGGHMVPTASGPVKRSLLEFLDRFEG